MNLILRAFGGNAVDQTPLGMSVISLMQEAEDDLYEVEGGHSLIFSDNRFENFKKNIVLMLAKIKEHGIQERHYEAIEKCIGILKSIPVIEFFKIMTEIDRLSLDREPDSLSDIALRYLLQDKALSARLTNIHRISAIADIISLENVNSLRKNVKYLHIQITQTLFHMDDDEGVDDTD
jgi:hypothetical protein